MNQMENYHALMSNVMQNGIDQLNKRTGQVCRVIPGAQLQYDLREGFPAITTKKLIQKGGKGELLGFFRGYTNAADFRALGCHFWDQNANETKAWLENPNRIGHDDLGRIYSSQWTDWKDRRVVDTFDTAKVEYLEKMGYKTIIAGVAGVHVMERSINQLENSLRTIITNPSDRRILVNGYNPGELDLMSLPPCHMNYAFIPMEEQKELHVVMFMRSADLFLGVPVNIYTTSLFLSIMARLAGYTPATVTIQMANCHIYESHFDAVKEQLARSHFPSPKLVLSDEIPCGVSVDEIPGVFTRIEPHHISLEGYQCHDAIKAPMAA